MIKAGDKHLDKFTWGDAEQFHTIETEAKKFRLFQDVEVLLKDGTSVVGEIGFIGEASFDILPVGESAQNIYYKDVQAIIETRKEENI